MLGLPMEPAPPAKILVVDDNAQNRALARETLEDEGYQVILAENGEAGIHAVEAERPDCVLLDIRMPGTDGFAVCARIRALPEARETPVVFVTASARQAELNRYVGAGAVAVVSKPFDAVTLARQVRGIYDEWAARQGD